MWAAVRASSFCERSELSYSIVQAPKHCDRQNKNTPPRPGSEGTNDDLTTAGAVPATKANPASAVPTSAAAPPGAVPASEASPHWRCARDNGDPPAIPFHLS